MRLIGVEFYFGGEFGQRIEAFVDGGDVYLSEDEAGVDLLEAAISQKLDDLLYL